MSHVALDLASKVAPFEQIKASIIGPLAAGELPADHKLPAGRRFRAADFGSHRTPSSAPIESSKLTV
jgi:DNA-binding transcriptional regulator YhcF (GntR family)